MATSAASSRRRGGGEGYGGSADPHERGMGDTHEVSVNEVRESQQGERQQRRQRRVKPQELIHPDVVLRVTTEIVASQQVEEIRQQNSWRS